MSNQNIISAENFNGFTWIRCDGKGSFQNSPQMKSWAECQIKSGIHNVVIDLEQCTGMDSTFMGTMAGIAMKLAKLKGGKLQVAEASDKNRRSLEDLGLSMLIEINPKSPHWEEELTSIRSSLVQQTEEAQIDKTAHVFDAHKLLCEADSSNDAQFSTVLDILEAELASKQRSR